MTQHAVEHDQASAADERPARPWLSVVIPAFNERARLPATLDAVRAYAAERPGTLEVIVVDDGSSDRTAELAEAFDARPAVLRVLRNGVNRGKGFSVRRGMLSAGGELRLMMDADSSVDVAEVERLLPWVRQGCDIVIGSRDVPGAVLDPPQPLARRVAAWAFRALRRGLLLSGIRDTQCGFKLFTAEAAEAVFPRQVETGWLFDCEVLALAERSGRRMRECPITWRNRPGSRVPVLATALLALPALMRIRARLGSRR